MTQKDATPLVTYATLGFRAAGVEFEIFEDSLEGLQPETIRRRAATKLNETSFRGIPFQIEMTINSSEQESKWLIERFLDCQRSDS